MLRETVAYFPSLYSIYATFSIGFFNGLIELVKAQLKVWEYKCVLIVGNPHWPYAYKTTETYTYEYAMLTPSPHKMKLVLTHHLDAHPIPYLHVEVVTADKK